MTATRFISKSSFVLAISLMLALACGVGMAYAASSSSYTVKSGSYSAFSTVRVDGNSERGSVTCMSQTAEPAGHLGGWARLFRDGSLVASKGPTYSDVKTSGFQVNAYLTSSVKGNYYAEGIMYYYQVGGYKTLSTGATPKLTKKIAPLTPQQTDYEKNSLGLEYGSLLNENVVGHAPDLVEVVATNGQQGYVRLTELEIEPPSTPEEAIDIANNPYTKSINVYDQDMQEILGQFTLSVGGTPDAL